MSTRDQLIAYISQVTTDISQETTADSLDPNIIGDMGVDLATILKDFVPLQNNFTVTAGIAFPIGGGDTDLHFRYTAGNILIYRNIAGTWTLLATLPISFTLQDGIMIGLRVGIKVLTATVTPGTWIIANAQYNKNTQTQFTLAAADPSFDRYDLIYADEANDILIITGAATLVPVKPALPANCIIVDYIYIPAIGLPYALSNPPASNITPDPIVALAANQDIDGNFTIAWNSAKVSQFGIYGRFKIEQADTYQDVPITIVKDITTNLPTAYKFSLSGIDSLIHII